MEVRKFIIVDNQIIMGLVEFHHDLLPKSKPKSNFMMIGEIKTEPQSKPIGGGRWEYNNELYPGKVFFFGKSHEFGSVTEQQLRDAWENSLISPFIENCEIIFSTQKHFSQVLIEKGL